MNDRLKNILLFNQAAAPSDPVTQFTRTEMLIPTADTVLSSANPTTNYNTLGLFLIGDASGEKCRELFKFPMTFFNTVTPTDVKLWLRTKTDNSSNARTFRIYRMKRNWVANQATWNIYSTGNNWQTAGGFGADDCEQTEIASREMSASEPINTYLYFTLPTTSAEIDAGYGLLAKADTESADNYAFGSLENSGKPILAVTYTANVVNAVSGYTKHPGNPLTGATNVMFGSVWYAGENDYHLYASDGTNVNHYTSTDGVSWTADVANNPVMTPAVGATDVVMVWKESSTWYMLYRSTEWGAGVKKIGLATSANGISWTKSGSNPVISPGAAGAWDSFGTGIDPWGIIKVGSTYYLWYNHIDAWPRMAGLATSTNLTTWTKDANNPIFTNNEYCVFPFKSGSYYYMLVPRIANPEELSAAVGAADRTVDIYRDTSPTFYPADREFVGVAIHAGANGTWDDNYLDTPCVLTSDIQRSVFPNGTIQMYYTGWPGGSSSSGWKMGLATGAIP